MEPTVDRRDALSDDLLAEPFEPGALGAKHFGRAAGLELLDDAVTLLGSPADCVDASARIDRHGIPDGSLTVR